VLRSRPLGGTGFEVTELSLGGAGLGGLYGAVPQESGVATVLLAVAEGINYVEAAPFYGDFESALGEALTELGEGAAGLHLCTKVGLHPERSGDYSAEATRWSVERSLRTLGVEAVDLVQVHAMDAIPMDVVLAPDGSVSELERLRDEGKVRALGFGIRGAEYHRSAIRSGRFDVILIHDDFSLIRRTDRSLISEAADAGMGVLVGRVLMTGLLAGEDPTGDARLAVHPDARAAHGWWRWATERHVPLQALALQFVLREPGVSSAVVGASSAAEISENAAAVQHPLPDGIWDEVEERMQRIEASPN
jgi:aryl-alcohol dehydrogenase-like predicted oxidoreductase